MKPNPFPQLLHAFFHGWLVHQRNVSHHTVLSYRHSWRLFLRFVAAQKTKSVAKLGMDDLTVVEVLAFLKDVEQVFVNGHLEKRVPHNLNMSFNYVEGESLMMGIKGLAVSSGSACTSASLEPSYVLRALGRSDELAHSSLRMTIGRWTTEAEIDYAVETIKVNVAKLRELSPLWDMYKEGIDISTIQWATH